MSHIVKAQPEIVKLENTTLLNNTHQPNNTSQLDNKDKKIFLLFFDGLIDMIINKLHTLFKFFKWLKRSE